MNPEREARLNAAVRTEHMLAAQGADYQQTIATLRAKLKEQEVILALYGTCKVCGAATTDFGCARCLIDERDALRAKLKQAEEAMSGMLDNYITLKQISLALARSDAPNWAGARLTADDDIHVIAVRAALQSLRKEGV